MDLYHYFPDTLELAAITPAEPDPLEWAEARQAVRGPLVAAAQARLQAAMKSASGDLAEDPDARAASIQAAAQAHAEAIAAAQAHAEAIAAAEAEAEAVKPTVWLVPAFATLLPPPEAGPDQVVRFVEDQWVLFDLDPEPGPEPDAPLDLEALAARGRFDRDHRLQSVRWLIERHRDERDLFGATTLSPEQFGRLLTYVQQLRDITTQAGFPAAIDWPVQPSFIDPQETK